MFGKPTEEHCRFCGASLAPEEVHRLEVPFFDRTYEVCAPCRESFRSGSRTIEPFEPRFRGDRTYRWAGPLASDALLVLRAIGVAREDASFARRSLETLAPRLATLAEPELAELLAAGAILGEEAASLDELARAVDRRGRDERTPLLLGIYAHATAGVPLAGRAVAAPRSTARRHLDAARSAYLLHLSYSLKDELDGRVAALHATVSLQLGELDEAAAKLRQYRRQAEAAPAARDPRIPLHQALVHLATGNLAAVDEAIATAAAWARPRWPEVEALAHYDAYVRALDADRWEAAKDAIKAYVRLRPDDRRALYDLGHTFLRCALEPVAREVLASYHARDPNDPEGVLLYAACLARLGEHAEAWRLLRDDLEAHGEEGDRELAAERHHLAGLLARETGHDERALELLEKAFELDPSRDAAREDLVTVLLEELGRRVDELEPADFPDFVDFFVRFQGALDAEFGATGLALARAFIAREVQSEFAAAPSFGLDLFTKVRFGDADVTQLQAYELLAQRRLGDAVRRDRQAQHAGARPIPIGLLLGLLARIRSWSPEDRRLFL